MKKQLTLCIIHEHPRVLLGYKKRGFGAGRWNGFGGKIEKGETPEHAAHRELHEEAGITARDLHSMGTLEFTFLATNEILEVHVFRAHTYDGEPAESEEMRPQWFYIDEIPFSDMWPDDSYWFPFFLRGTPFFGEFHFDKDERLVKTYVKPR